MQSIFRAACLGPFTAAILAGSAALAETWAVVEEWRDPIAGRTYTVATATNDEGMSIAIFRDTDKRVRAVYSIPVNIFDRLPIEGRVMSLRPGDLNVVEVEAAIIDRGVTEDARSDGRNVRDLLWHGQDPSPTRGTLRNILDSETLYARFYTDTGDTIDTSWSLSGAPEAISTAVGISAVAQPEAIEWSALQAELLISSVQRCERDIDCMGKVTLCMDLLKSAADADAFRQCVDLAAS